MLVSCFNCNFSFNRKPSEVSGKNFCSKDCFSSHFKHSSNNPNHRGGKLIACVECGKEHYRTPSSKITDNPTCSRKCMGAVRARIMTGSKAGNFKNALTSHVCEKCESEFTSYSKNRKFCSRACKVEAQKHKSKVSCSNCRESFERVPSQVANKSQLFCSMSCRNAFKVGENSNGWKKDRTQLKDQNKSLRWSKPMVDWRKAVYERDNYTCQLCASKSSKGLSVRLNAHHIKTFHKHEHLRFDVSNGITLCEPCHKLTYGKEEDFEPVFIAKLQEPGHSHLQRSLDRWKI